MALQTFQQLPASSPFPAPKTSGITSRRLMYKTQPAVLNSVFHFQAIRIPERRRWRPRRMAVTNVVEESQESSEPESASAQQTLSESEEQQPAVQPSELASELKKAMQEREAKEEGNLLSGVAEEIREIEWPAFGKVLGTTGVVIGVILGSSVVLLTVNAIFAELSDTVFAGKGVQDFFS